MVAHSSPAYNFSVLLIVAATALAQKPDTGLAPGARIPSFALRDQSGISRDFNDIRGAKGAMLVFYRSADW